MNGEPLAEEKTGLVVPVAEGLPDQKPIAVAMDSAPPPEDEAARESAWTGEYVWKGQRLLPYTPTKRGLWERLCAADVALPINVAFANVEVYAPAALKLIYLLTHKAEEYRHLRGNTEAFLEVIDEWIDSEIAHHEVLDAAKLALKIHNETQKMQAVPQRAEGRDGGPGN